MDDDDDDEDDPNVQTIPKVHLEETVKALRHLVARDPLAADMQLSLFASAVFSHRYVSVAQPVPPRYCQPGGIHQLTEVLDGAPALRVLLSGGKAAALSPPLVLNLLQWLLASPATRGAPGGSLHALPRPASGPDTPSPNYFFEIINPLQEEKWRHVAIGKEVVTGFLGQSLDAFHCIIHIGLRPAGDNMKIRRTLKAALQDSTPGYGLGSSDLGARLRCVVECDCVVQVPGLAVASAGSDDVHLLLRDGRLARPTRLYVFKSDMDALSEWRPPWAARPGSRARVSTTADFKLPEFKFVVDKPSSKRSQLDGSRGAYQSSPAPPPYAPPPPYSPPPPFPQPMSTDGDLALPLLVSYQAPPRVANRRMIPVSRRYRRNQIS